VALDVTAEAEIGRPAADVADYAFDPANDSRWTSGIKSAEMLTDPPVRLGSRVRRVATFLGRRIHYVMEIVGFEPGRMLQMHAIESPFPMDVTYELAPIGPDRTRARIRVQGAGGYRLAEPLMSHIVRRSITRDVRALKRILESR
jgi:Polyketide cyclase / dehydrase and lipid transport